MPAHEWAGPSRREADDDGEIEEFTHDGSTLIAERRGDHAASTTVVLVHGIGMGRKVFADLSDAEAVDTAMGYWNDINLPNLRENVEPTKHRATLVLNKAADHTVESVLLRKL